MPRLAAWAGAVALAWSVQAIAASAPLIDNERVTVWDVPLKVGEAAPATPADLDSVIMFLDGGRFKVTDAAGRPVATRGAPGDAVYIPRGASAVATLVSGGPAHAVLIALKDFKAPPILNPGKLPPAFPRAGSVKVLETPRVVVWNYSWKLGEATQPHFHDKDVVLAYREDGAIENSITLDGQHTVTPHTPGEIRFNPGNRSHFERLVSGRQSSITLELK